MPRLEEDEARRTVLHVITVAVPVPQEGAIDGSGSEEAALRALQEGELTGYTILGDTHGAWRKGEVTVGARPPEALKDEWSRTA